MSERDLPDLPSDDDLGIAGLDEEELLRELEEERTTAREPPPPRRSGPPSGPPPGVPPRDRGVRPADGPPPLRPASWIPALAAGLVLAAGTWAFSADRHLPGTVPANAPDTVFSSSRAMSQLVEIARAPRPVGAPEHTRVRELLLDRLRELGLEPEVQTSLSLRRQGQTVQGVTVRNVVARIPGTASTGAIVLTAHYDAVPVSHGAGDDATGVAAILEVVRALRAGPPPDNDVIVLFTDAEEIGLLGARAFVEEHPWMDDVAVVLSVEMRGGGGPSIMFETGADNGWIIQAMKAGDPRPFAHSLSVEVYRRLPNDTDFTAFRRAGVQGLNFAAIGDAWIYHQATDVPANVSERTLQHHGMRVLGITRELAGRDLAEVYAPDRVHFVLPGLGLVHFPTEWMLPAGLVVLLLWLAVAALAYGRGAGPVGMLVGFALSLLAAALTAGAGWGLIRWLPRYHPEFGTMTPAFHGEGWYVLSLVVVAVGVGAALFGLARRRYALSGLTVGALAGPVVGGVAAAAIAPLVAVVVVGSALAGVAAAAVVASAGAADERGDPARTGAVAGAPSPVVWVAGLGLALPVLALLVPVIELLWVAMSLRLAAVLGLLVVTALICMVPALDALSAPGRRWAPAVAAVAGLALGALLVAGGLLTGGPSEARPLPSTLIYVLERDDGQAAGHSGHWVTRPGPGMGWAVRQVDAPFRDDVPLGRFALPGGLPAAGASPLDVPRPDVALIDWREPQAEDEVGWARVAVRSSIGAEVLAVILAEDGPAVPVAMNGQPLPPAPSGTPGAGRPVILVRHQGVPEEDALVLELDVRSGALELRLVVVEEHYRAGELLGAERFRRPPGLAPSTGFGERGGPSDRAILRTPVVVPLVVEDAPGAEAIASLPNR